MSRNDGPAEGVIPLTHERKRVFEALDGVALSGPAVFRRIRERSAWPEGEAGHGMEPGDQSLLYPALHSLEAGWKLQAAWQSDASGTKHRTYRKRRLLPRPLGWVIRS
jgi:hypothetical protein